MTTTSNKKTGRLGRRPRPRVRVSEPAVETMILLPTRGTRAIGPSAYSAPFFLSLNSTFAAAGGGMAMHSLTGPGLAHSGPQPQVRVLDSVHEDGAKLVAMSPFTLSTLRATQPGIRAVPLRYYSTEDYTMQVEDSPAVGVGGPMSVTLSFLSSADGSPIGEVSVVAFTNFAARQGAEGTTDAQGRVRLRLPSQGRIERLYAYPKRGYWSLLKKNVAMAGAIDLRLTSIDPASQDGLRHFYGNAAAGAGAGALVGVIDTGVGPHPDLVVQGGVNTVVGEPPANWQDNGEGHGTHVAGIVAARGTPPHGVSGIAPGAALRSYRVFGQAQPRASNYAILKAIDAAVADQCDIINLSLGGQLGPDGMTQSDEALQTALEEAWAAGVLPVAAAGNDSRKPVSFPALDPTCVAVTALGRKGTFPPGTTETDDVAPPPGMDPNDFIAAFSNIGPEVDLTAPGVGVISTIPGGLGVMSGTSMAAPAVAGFVARLLAANAALRAMPRGGARAAALAQALAQAARSLGFGPSHEGQGVPQ